MNPRATGWILIALSAAAFGTLGVFVKLAYRESVDPYSALAFRFVIATLILAPVAAIRRKPLPPASTLRNLFLFGSCGYVAHSLCYFTALKHASAGLVGLLLYLYPALVCLGGALFFGERLGRGRWIALGLALAGTAMALSPGPGNHPMGIVLALSCAVIYGAYILACSRVARGTDALTSATVIIAGAALIYGVTALVLRSPLPVTSDGWLLVAAIGISTPIAIGALFAAMERIGATSASVGSTLEPMVTVVLSFLFLDERLTVLQIAGGAMIIATVVWLATRPPASSP